MSNHPISSPQPFLSVLHGGNIKPFYVLNIYLSRIPTFSIVRLPAVRCVSAPQRCFICMDDFSIYQHSVHFLHDKHTQAHYSPLESILSNAIFAYFYFMITYPMHVWILHMETENTHILLMYEVTTKYFIRIFFL
mgnify:CR=1 FL=1